MLVDSTDKGVGEVCIAVELLCLEKLQPCAGQRIVLSLTSATRIVLVPGVFPLSLASVLIMLFVGPIILL